MLKWIMLSVICGIAFLQLPGSGIEESACKFWCANPDCVYKNEFNCLSYCTEAQIKVHENLCTGAKFDDTTKELQPADTQLTEEEQEFKSLAKKQGCALVVMETSVRLDVINTPIAVINFYNNFDKDIDALELIFYCYNTFGDPVKLYGHGDHSFKGIAQNITILPKTSIQLEWTLHGQQLTTQIKNPTITRIHFTDGTMWKKK